VFAFRESNIEDTTEMGEFLKCNIKTQADLVACLREEPLETLMQAQMSIMVKDEAEEG